MLFAVSTFRVSTKKYGTTLGIFTYLVVSCANVCSALMKKQPTVLVSHLESLGVIAPPQPEKISGDGRATAGQDDGMIPTTTGRLTLDAWKWNLPAANWLRPCFFGALTFHNQFDQTLSARKVECSSQYYLQLRAPSWLTRRAWDI